MSLFRIKLSARVREYSCMDRPIDHKLLWRGRSSISSESRAFESLAVRQTLQQRRQIPMPLVLINLHRSLDLLLHLRHKRSPKAIGTHPSRSQAAHNTRSAPCRLSRPCHDENKALTACSLRRRSKLKAPEPHSKSQWSFNVKMNSYSATRHQRQKTP